MSVLKNIYKMNKEKYSFKNYVEDIIQIVEIYEDGIILLNNNTYSKSYKYLDINYAISSNEDKERLFLKYSELLNSLDSAVTTKISIINRKINKSDFEQSVLFKPYDDNLNCYRDECNNWLINQSKTSNDMIQEKIITVSINKSNISEARSYFTRVSAELNNHFVELGSKCVEQSIEDRLRLLHDFYRNEKDEEFVWNNDIKETKDLINLIIPEKITYNKEYLKLDNKYVKVVYLKNMRIILKIQW